MYSWQLSSLLLRRVNFKYTNGNHNLVHMKHFGTRVKFGNCHKKLNLWLKEQRVQVAKACTKQFEFIVAQRIRRGIQIFHLYTRMWDEVALKEFIKSWRRRVVKNTKHFLISAVGVSVYNWDQERISDKELYSYSQEIEGIYRLRDSTVVCTNCQLRVTIDTQQPGIDYCKCKGINVTAINNQDSEGWQPFIERQDMLIWRKQDKDTGLYSYKVYGSFADVTAEDFLQVQIDIDYRKHWDTTAHELKILDTDPKLKCCNDHNADVIYWELIWPKLFANRGYVYQRRWVIDKEKNIVVIVSKGTDHPDAPTRPGTYRVTTYWSYMVIKPFTEFHEPGIEFGLTYFDDPGVKIPSAITSWVAITGLSDYLSRMRQASKDYKEYKMKHKLVTSDSHTSLNQVDLNKSENLSKMKTAEDENLDSTIVKKQEGVGVEGKEEKEEQIKEKEDSSSHNEYSKRAKPVEIRKATKEDNAEENEENEADSSAAEEDQEQKSLISQTILIADRTNDAFNAEVNCII